MILGFRLRELRKENKMSQSDLGKLIGKNGIIAKAIREVVGIAAKIENKKLFVKFEAYNEE